MKTIKKLNSLIAGIAIAFSITMFIPSQAQATSWSWSSYTKDNSCDTDKELKSSKRNKGSKKYKSYSYKKNSKNCNKTKKYKKYSYKKKSRKHKKVKKYKGSSCDDSKPTPTPEPGTCNECDGKITTLTLKYNGNDDALIEVYGKKGEEIFIGTVGANEIFTLEGFDKKGTLGTKVYISINGDECTNIHTSCSVPILVGMDFGDFTVTDGYSRNGGQLCTVPGYEPPTEKLQCPSDFTHLSMSVWTAGKNDSDNLQTSLSEIFIPDHPATISFINVLTGDTNDHQQPHEQFKIVTVDHSANVLESTNYTKDINNYTQNDELSNLGTISLVDASELILVHRADPTYGDNLSYYNSVTFKGLCYKIEEITPPEPEIGNVCGTVYEDLDNNDLQEANEQGIAGLSVELIDVNGDIHLTNTVIKGDYCFQDMVVGLATITVLTLPAGAYFSAGDNPNDIIILADENNPAGKDAYQIEVP